jgi:hypothetical protein
MCESVSAYLAHVESWLLACLSACVRACMYGQSSVLAMLCAPGLVLCGFDDENMSTGGLNY